MADIICLFEDKYYRRLLPLVYFRPVYDLRCGITTLREKILRAYPRAKLTLECRDYLTEVVRQQTPVVSVNESHPGGCLFLNGRVLADTKLAKKIPVKGENAVFVNGDSIVAIRSDKERLDQVRQRFAGPDVQFDETGFSRIEVDVTLISYPWDLVKHNGEQIGADFAALVGKGKKSRGKVYPGAHLLNKKDIFIDTGAKVKPGVVLDAENGPIYIGKNATIFPNATIEGSAFIGDDSRIKIGAKIYEHTSIGEMCKVGGEVEASIIHSYSNKQHDGFLGHAYLGMWCNLGADTNNSDLKNNYGSVKVTIDGEEINSGSQFVGLTMGDHSKSGINTMFNTGTVVGVSSNVFGADFPPKCIPSFAWGGSVSLETYQVEKAIDVARKVMSRRNVKMTAADETLFRHVFTLTEKERE
jgi:UDP-N-acetylglucosamine diphosphorylase/glucosamine-1-phosphate N-acetyltransferase